MASTSAANRLVSSGFWTGNFSYKLPEELIAQRPANERANSRLMIVDRLRQRVTNARFVDLRSNLLAGDLLVLNDTRVVSARLLGHRVTGGRVEVIVLDSNAAPTPVIMKSSKRLRDGEVVGFSHPYRATVVGNPRSGRGWVDFGEHTPQEVMAAAGTLPLPPYIRRADGPTLEDAIRYQTVYATEDGSVAAPTAGLHFTRPLLDELQDGGVEIGRLTLHVGPGTFTPIRGPASEHRMEAEYCVVSSRLVEQVTATRAAGNRVIAVGTTSVRALESAARGGKLGTYEGRTDLFIRPGHRFAVVDGLVTNFHLPGSTLLCLVMALAGESLTHRAYETAVNERYRFYSYGDAMLVV